MLIGLTGKMGVGKTTALAILSSYTENFNNVKFAQPLYDIQEFIYSRISSAYDRPPDFNKDRKLLQFIGSDWGREVIDKDLWIKIWKKTVSQLPNNSIITCDDVRYNNEAEAVRSMGGNVIEILSSKASSRISTTNGFFNHMSEQGISNNLINYTALNDGTLAEFHDKLKKVFESIKAQNNQVARSK